MIRRPIERISGVDWENYESAFARYSRIYDRRVITKARIAQQHADNRAVRRAVRRAREWILTPAPPAPGRQEFTITYQGDGYNYDD